MEIILKYFTDFTAKQSEQFIALKNLYEEWNEKINVISRKDIHALYEKHVLHSLSIAAIVDFKPGTQIIDIGTGGGFPGLPLAIFFPEAEFLLADSIAKKLKVVHAIKEEIGLQNVQIIHSRVEDIRNRKFDFAVSRAVAPLKELWKWSKPLIKKTRSNDIANGLICLKGGDLTTEIFESGLRPFVTPLYDIFPEENFKEKFLLHVPR